jgi:CHAT domain-containing protein
VAIINVSGFRSDALILGPDGVRVAPLPGLREQDAAARAEAFLSDVTAAFEPGAAADRVADTLGWLWAVVAAPVLEAIGVTGPPTTGAPWPRLWWVPTGPLAFLPLHAAGSGQADGTVLDRVISSYLPTVRSLPDPASSVKTAPAGTAAPTALAVAMTETPGMDDLSLAEEEAAHVAARVPGTTVLIGAEATGAAVRDLLPEHAWAHFACHAVSSPADAAGAQLRLHDHLDREFAVRDIAALRNDRAELAYLSACDTAHGPQRLADEAIHLTGAFHLAGYPHVIGTLWSISDPIAAAVARSVYDDITTPAPDADKAAEALHNAVRDVREANPDTPAIWAAHIHVGP